MADFDEFTKHVPSTWRVPSRKVLTGDSMADAVVDIVDLMARNQNRKVWSDISALLPVLKSYATGSKSRSDSFRAIDLLGRHGVDLVVCQAAKKLLDTDFSILSIADPVESRLYDHRICMHLVSRYIESKIFLVPLLDDLVKSGEATVEGLSNRCDEIRSFLMESTAF